VHKMTILDCCLQFSTIISNRSSFICKP